MRRYYFIPIKMITIKKKKKEQKIAGVNEDIKKLKGLYTIGGSVKWYSAMKNSMVVPQKIRNRITI